MRILMLTQVLPYPPDSGGKIKAFHLIRYLAQRHDVILASLIRSPADRAHVASLAPYCRRIETVVLRRSRARDAMALAKSYFRGVPFLIERDRSREMEEVVLRLVREERLDLIHAVQVNMAPYVLGIAGIATVLDQENAVSTIVERMYRMERPGPRKLLAWLEWRRLARYEGWACGQFDHVLAVTEDDRQALERLDGMRAPISVIPIGVDCEAIRPVQRRPGARGILSVGTMFYPPNVDGVLWFAREVLPLITPLVPDATFNVVGKNPSAEVRQLQEGEQPVVVSGYVEDLTPSFAQCAVFVVPLRMGGGMRVKILDAWARGLPVVSTTIGAEGIEVRNRENILLADSPQHFGQAVVQVMKEKDLARHLAENGRCWVESRYDWQVSYKLYDEVLKSLI